QHQGESYLSLGKFEQAREFFINYNQLIEELFQANPHSYQLINGRAISYYKLGDISRAMQQFVQAKAYWVQAQDIWRQLHQATGIPQLAGYLETVAQDLERLKASRD
ncbi:MAG: hypothetical protein AAF804_09500, partial [Bacteroidota bacterium]